MRVASLIFCSVVAVGALFLNSLKDPGPGRYSVFFKPKFQAGDCIAMTVELDGYINGSTNKYVMDKPPKVSVTDHIMHVRAIDTKKYLYTLEYPKQDMYAGLKESRLVEVIDLMYVHSSCDGKYPYETDYSR
jgi:hypothetical protein